MRQVALKAKDRTLIAGCNIARSFFSRLIGLMGRKNIGSDEALCFPRCNSIHTFCMRFAIDVVFVSREGQVVFISNALRPWRLVLPKRNARHVVEMAAGRASELGIQVGTQLSCEGIF